MAQAESELDPTQSAAHRFGYELRAYRRMRNLSQRELGEKVHVSGDLVAMVEKAKRHPQPDFAKRCDQALDASGELVRYWEAVERERRVTANTPTHADSSSVGIADSLGVLITDPNVSASSEEDGAAIVPVRTADGRVEYVSLPRRRFVQGMSAVTLNLATNVIGPSTLAGKNALASAANGEEEVSRFRNSLRNLYALDEQYGGESEVYGLTIRLLHQVRRRLEQGTYSASIEHALRSLAGEITEHAGWLAYDAGRHHDARYWWLEALHSARMSDSDTAEVVVLASMALQASQQGRGREAVDLVSAARKAAKVVTPRLGSILSAREARGYARTGDNGSVARALSEAYKLLSRGSRDDDPSWSGFWGPADLALHETVSMYDIGNMSAAESSARQALENVNVAEHPRNHALYLIQLARVLTRQQTLDEAVPVTAHAVSIATEVNSARVVNDVRAVLDSMRRHANSPDVHDLLEWSATVLPAA